MSIPSEAIAVKRGKGDDNGGRNTEGNFNVIRVLMTLLKWL